MHACVSVCVCVCVCEWQPWTYILCRSMMSTGIVQELCESRGGRPGWAVRPNKPYGFCGCKAILNHSALVTACP